MMSDEFEDIRRRPRRGANGERVSEERGSAAAELIAPPSRGTGVRPGFVMAVVLIAAGSIFFLSNLGLMQLHDIWRYWPLVLMAIGLSKLSNTHGPLGSVWAILLLVAGALLLMANLNILHIHIGMLWPLVLIGVGVFLLTKSMTRHAVDTEIHLPSKETSFVDSDDVLREWTVFGGVKRIVDSQDFRGGELMSVFGGIDVDLRRARIIPRDKPVVIDANAAFGGVNIKVPDTWRVAVRGVGVFGGYEDKTIRPRPSEAVSPLLIITGFSAFGGVVVE